MSNQAKKIINYINDKMTVTSERGGNPVSFPENYGIPKDEAITLIDVYHDVVTNRKIDLPTDNDKIKAITKEMRKILGIADSDKRRLWPTAIVLELKKITNIIFC